VASSKAFQVLGRWRKSEKANMKARIKEERRYTQQLEMRPNGSISRSTKSSSGNNTIADEGTFVQDRV